MSRTHVMLADGLLEAIDAVAGRRGRSRFLEQAALEKLARLELEAAVRETSGIVGRQAYPAWSTRERAAEWVRRTRETEQAG